MIRRNALAVPATCTIACLTIVAPARWQGPAAQAGFVFDRVGHVRELPDGTLLVTETLGRVLFAVSPGGQRKQIGRKGDGPGEYRSPGAIVALGESESVVVDNLNRRWLHLQQTTFTPFPSGLRDLNLRVQGVLGGIARDGRALDVRGHGAYARLPFPLADRTHPIVRDSVALVMYKGPATADTVAYGLTQRYGGAFKRVHVRGQPDRYNAMHPLATHDQGVLFPDGTIAVARVAPYRVDWRTTNGSWEIGPVVADAMSPVTPNMRRELAHAIAAQEGQKPIFEPSDFPNWPSRVPAFISYSVLAGLDGRVYVLRTPLGAAFPRQVDVFDRGRGRIGSLTTPPATRVVGLGRRTLFVARSLDTGEEEVLRVPIPVFSR